MKLKFLLLFFFYCAHSANAQNCQSHLVSLLKVALERPAEISLDQLKKAGVNKRLDYVPFIVRTGKYHQINMQGLVPGLFEVEISKLTPLHPIPNPLREKSSEKLDELMGNLEIYGFNLKFPIQVALFDNGVMRIVGGHHRVKAMEKLGEMHIPAQVYLWSSLKPEVRKMYQETFIDPLSRRFPQFYQDL